ncbi:MULTISPECIES: LLM class flavin-dependent oxidoreductase [unclassified Chelatococcus]|uniref:LLM class flavin-dependent oxidoreductase n=1 Tax=unclassified Chelatococcus TaxID=2638111 RepID=UPI001BD0AA4F|nr:MULTISPECIES: LLM class flavin-dependent oxidoreductase [unclassified Chelatococcus]MBS7700260.1 LLM class flavin-dependent oxidoreductase [Chelatococcus sp. YT9]MBX3558231.1 LLM class flavin-dependent oxidoreductase [Chelatococcus sp.]
MQVYHFTECPYTPAWKHADRVPIRNVMPNRYFDPAEASKLLNERLDEWALADELGLNIMVNEHHATSTSLSVSGSLPLAIMARETRSARLLVLGIPLGMRHDPVLVAEEMAYADVISGGRLEMGLVKGGGVELGPTNSNPATLGERFWEAHDIVLAAMTHHDGPFNYEGRHFQYRQINIWPRPYQQPHPPVWMTCFSPATVREVADRGYVVAATLSAVIAKAIFDAYRKRWAELGRSTPANDRFSYMAQIAVGHTEEQGLARLSQVRRYAWASSLSAEQYSSPPGYKPAHIVAKALRNPANGSMFTNIPGRQGPAVNPVICDPRDLIDPGVGFGGTPDQVYEQIVDFYRYCGGFGHLTAMMHGGPLSHADTADSLKLFAREVMPRLREFTGEEAKKVAA